MSTLPYQKHSHTSKVAAFSFEESAASARYRVFLAIQRMGGATDEEVQDFLDMNSSTQRPRRVELVRAGLVENSGKTKVTKSGSRAFVWVVVPEGVRYCDAVFDSKKLPELQGLAKALFEIERAIPSRKRSPELISLLDRLHQEDAPPEDSNELLDFFGDFDL